MKLSNIPTRLAAGGYVLHSGMEKWGADADTAAGTHGLAAAAFPAVTSLDPVTFLKGLSVAEMATGAVLLAPFVKARTAGAALTAFAGGLVAMYARTPALRKPGSVWPTPQGIGVSKDVWLLGIGLGLLLDRRRPARGGKAEAKSAAQAARRVDRAAKHADRVATRADQVAQRVAKVARA